MSAHIVIAGATGFFGRVLQNHFRSQGKEVRTIGRSWDSDALFDRPSEVQRVLDGASLLVNLAGRSINCRYTERNRAAILDSRVLTTRALRHAIANIDNPPPVWCNASTATVYKHSATAPATESDPADEFGFAEDVARSWEAVLYEGELPATRRVPMRISILLGDGPATNILFRLARLGLGGPQHDGRWLPHTRYRGINVDRRDPFATFPSAGQATHGKQHFSWIHVQDAARAVDHIVANPDITGPVNFASPQPTTNAELMATLRKLVSMPIGLPAYRWMLEPAMWALRTESELVLKSRWVMPGVLNNTGFTFQFPEIGPAAADVWAQIRQR